MSPKSVVHPRLAGLFLASLVVLLSLTVAPLVASPQDSTVDIAGSQARTWTSADGKFRQEGTLVAVEGDKIRIESGAGKSITAPLAKLSADDQAFVKQELARMTSADSPFTEEGDASPFSESAGSAAGPVTEAVDPDMTPIAIVPMESGQPLDLKAERWQIAPPPKSKGFRFQIESIHTSVARSFASPDHSLFVASLHDPFGTDYFGPQQTETSDAGGDGKCKSWIELVNLTDGKSRGRFPLPTERTVAADIDPAGKVLLAFDGTFSRDPKLHLFEITSEGLVPRAIWFARDSRSNNDAVRSARLLPDGKVVAHIRDELVVWDARQCQPLYSFPNSDENWRLASDGRHALVEHGGRKFEVDLVDGKCTAVQGGADGDSIAGTPSPDGNRLAELAHQVVTIRDINGKVEAEFYAPVFWPTPTVTWLDERTLQVHSPNQTHFIDLEHQVVLLELTNVGSQSANAAWNVDKQEDRGRWFVVVKPAGAQLPGAGQLPDLYKCRGRLPEAADDLLLFQEGDRVALSIEFESDPSMASDAKKALAQLLKDRGVRVDDSANDQLRLRSTTSNEQVEYRSFGVPPWRNDGAETVNVRTVTNTAELVRDGKVVWSRSSATGPGFMLHMQDGESAQQAADRQAGNPADFWKSLRLPETVAIHPNGGAWFRVMSTPNGYQVIE